MTVQLFAQLQGGTGPTSYRELDIYGADPIKITKTISSIEDPQENSSSFSQTFRIPNTSSNGQFFKAVFNVNSVSFDASKKANAYINVDGAYFTSGYIQLEGIYKNDSEGMIEYEILFIGEIGAFGSSVASKDLSSLDMSDLWHILNYSNIVLSWTGNLLNGNVLYPLAEYGYDYDPSTKIPLQSTLAVYDPVLGVKGFTNINNPLSVNQFKPFIKAKYIWDKIFEEAGFTYESDFIQSSFFQNIYMISSTPSTSTADTAESIEFSAGFATNQIPYYFNSPYRIRFGVEYLDNTNSLFIPPHVFVVPESASYQLILTEILASYTTTIASGNPATFSIIVYVGNTPYITKAAYVSNLSGGSFYSGNVYSDVALTNPNFIINGFFNQGDVISIYVNIPSNQFSQFKFHSGKWNGSGPDMIIPSGLLPEDYKQGDFIKGINDRFKLMWEPDRNNPRKFYIEPWIDWIKGGEQKDWTSKLNEEDDMIIKPLFQGQPRELIFKDSEEEDLYNFSYQQSNKQTFGQINKDSGIEILTGDNEISSMFSAFPIGPIGLTGTFLIPHFAKDTETERQPIQIRPRLCFYNGLIGSPMYWYFDDGSTVLQWDQYPLVSSFYNQSSPALGSPLLGPNSFDLSWTNVPQFWKTTDTYLQDLGDGRTTQTSFSRYWETWFNFNYDPYSRIMEASFALDYSDIYNLNFNDKIFIKDSYWMPIEVSDYELGTKQNVRVTLVKLGEFGISIGGVGTPLLYIQEDLCFDSDTEDWCGACCCYNRLRKTIWSDGPTLADSTFIYGNAEGTIGAQSGVYKQGDYIYAFNSQGAIIADYQCSIECDCGSVPREYEFGDIYKGSDPCTVCCDGERSENLWGTSSNFIDNINFTFGPTGVMRTDTDTWFRKGDDLVLIGSDGFTVIARSSCVPCKCDRLMEDDFVSVGVGVDSVYGACCGGTGFAGFDTVFSSTGFGASSEFYYDPFEDSPVGGTGSVWISDGKDAIAVTGGTASGSISCTPYYPGCTGRTLEVKFTEENLSDSYIEYSGIYNFSPDGYNTLYAGEYSATGTSIEHATYVDYDPNQFIQFNMQISGGLTAGSATIKVIKDSVELYSDENVPTPTTFVSDFYLGSTGDWEMIFSYNGDSYDLDALAFVLQGGLDEFTETEKTALDVLVKGLKANNLWNKFIAFYPFIGTGAAQRALNLKDPDGGTAGFNLTFYGGWTHGATGSYANGTNAYANTWINAISVNSNIEDQHISLYLPDYTTSQSSSDPVHMGAIQTATSAIHLIANQYAGGAYNLQNTRFGVATAYGANSSPGGLYLGRRNADGITHYKNDTEIVSTDGGGTLPTNRHILIANTTVGGLSTPYNLGYTKDNFALASYGYYMTDEESSDFYDLVEAFQTALGRNAS